MPKLAQKMVVTRNETFDYMLDVATPWLPGLPEEFKHYPGAAWDPKRKVWKFPAELGGVLEKISKKYGLAFQCENSLRPTELEVYNQTLRPYQKIAVSRSFWNGRWMINFEMGLGKTVTAIEVLRNQTNLCALIVAPANVRLVWKDELAKWWPEHPAIAIYEQGKQEVNWSETPIVITSYELFQKLALPGDLSMVVFDESHNLKTAKAARSEVAKALLHTDPSLRCLALTGTPICNEPMDLWNQLDTLWPGRFGSFFKFCEAYCLSKENDYASSGKEFYGANPMRAAELEMRLTACSSRVTKAQVADQLPAFSLEVCRVRAAKPTNFKKMMKELKLRAHENQLEAWCRESGEAKFPIVRDFVEQSIEAGSQRICVLTHYRDSVEKIAELVRPFGYVVTTITGDVPPSKRHKIIEEAKLHDKSILISTMHAVAEGIDLTRWNNAIFAELYWQPKTVLQAMARFHRLSSKEPCSVKVLVLEGTHEELIASSLQRKMGAAKQLVAQSAVEGALEGAMSQEMTEEQFLADLKAAAASKWQEDEYV